MDFQQLGDEIAQRVGETMAEVEERAQKIIEDAEREAGEIRARAESEARQRLADVRQALDKLETSITGESATVAIEQLEAEAEQAGGKEQEAEAEQEAAEDLPEAEVTGEGGDGEIDEAGARLVAMEMALDGEDVEAIATRLTEEFGLVDARDLATEVHGRAAP